MTICRRCGAELRKRPNTVWDHKKPVNHAALPQSITPETEAEKRLAHGDR